MTELGDTHHVERHPQRLRFRVENFGGELKNFLNADGRALLTRKAIAMYLYSEKHYDLPVDVSDRAPGETEQWEAYQQAIGTINPRVSHKILPATNEHTFMYRYGVRHVANKETDRAVDVPVIEMRFPIVLSNAVLERVVAKPMFSDDDMEAIRNAHDNKIYAFYRAYHPISENLLRGLREPFDRLARSEAGLRVRELTVVDEKTGADTPYEYGSAERLARRLDNGLISSPESDDDAA